MKNTKIKLPNLLGWGRKYFFATLTLIFLLGTQGFLLFPIEITPEAKIVIERIAPYYQAAGHDRIIHHLDDLKIQYPNDYRDRTSNLSITAKISYLYSRTPDHSSGAKFLALLMKSLSQEYESASKSFSDFQNDAKYINPAEIIINPEPGEWVQRRPSGEIKEASQHIRKISSYLEGGALGGETHIYRTILKLPEEKVFEIQDLDKPFVERLSSALIQASKNKGDVKLFLGNMAEEVLINYESSRQIPELIEALSWRSSSTKVPLDWEAIKIGKNGTISKGHDISILTNRIYEDSTLFGFEIIPDIDSAALKIVMSRKFYSRRTPPYFFNELARALSTVSKKDVFVKAYMIEKEFRAKLLSQHDISSLDPFTLLKVEANQKIFDEESVKPASFQSADEIWKNFRNRFPFHFQTIGLSQQQPDGSYCMIISEPPPHVTKESITQCAGYELKLDVKTDTLGYDGWVKDIVLQVNPTNKAGIDTLYHRIYRHLYFINPQNEPLNLNTSAKPVMFSKHQLNFDIQIADIENWLLGEKAILFTRPNNKQGSPQSCTQILMQKQTGIWVSEPSVLVLWVLPIGANLDERKSEIRNFAEKTDLVLGSIKTSSCVAIIARKRILPESTLPFVRTETLLNLAAAPVDGLAQSYERNYIFAGKDKQNYDWAPIYLSDALQNTDFGGMLNIADQMLKSWSLNGTVDYDSKFRLIRQPESPIFQKQTNQLLTANGVRFNANMNGASQTFIFANHGELKNYSISNLCRTGGMTITYEPENMPQKTINEYEATGAKYFSELNSPIWVGNTRYALLFQIFKSSTIAVSKPLENQSKNINYQKLEEGVYTILTQIDTLNDARINRFFDGNAEEQDTENCKDRSNLLNAKKLIGKIKQEGGLEKIKEIAKAISIPSRTDDIALGLKGSDAHQLSKYLAEIKNSVLLPLLNMDGSSILYSYSQTNTNNNTHWIKSPLIVRSQSTEYGFYQTGGHSLNTPTLIFKLGQPSELAEFHADGYRKHTITVVTNKFVYSKLTPEIIARLVGLMKNGSRGLILKELSGLL